MSTATDESRAKPVTISIDAMGGDLGPIAVVAGMARAVAETPQIRFIVHGPEAELRPLIDKRKLTGHCEIRDVSGVVSMGDKPSHIMRRGQGTSMWSAIESVRAGEADVVVSCGNTGALLAISMVRLRKIEGVNRPAIACFWPSRNPAGFNIMLDVGADIRADQDDLLQFALMGSTYARHGLGVSRPRIGLLNNGTEEHKGRAELKVAHELITNAAGPADFEFVGFVEGGDIPSKKVDVIVTDGFTGNIALKTGEGTATLIRSSLREAFNYSLLSRFAALLAITSLRRLQKKIDPRQANGGVFLGLNGTVVKSHGSADATSFSAAIKLAFRLAEGRIHERLARRIAQVTAIGHEVQTEKQAGTDA